MKPYAPLRTCGSCMWIYVSDTVGEKPAGCPKCGFASYGAFATYGRNAYKFKFTQEPWTDRILQQRQNELMREVIKYNNKHYSGWDDPKY